jgi:hypothetical protein
VTEPSGIAGTLKTNMNINSHPMNTKRHLVTALCSLTLLAGASFASAQASLATRTISKPGNYTLSAGFNVNRGDAIIITASNVRLNLNNQLITTKVKGTGSGIIVRNARNVDIQDGRISGFNSNVLLENSSHVRVHGLSISGDSAAPNGGPTEIGLLMINSWACNIYDNLISGVNLGIFVRGEHSTGNRIFQNTLVGGKTPGNNLLGICYNPAPTPTGGTPNPAGPRGDSIYNNHIARFNYAIALSAGSISNIVTENTLASFTGPFADTAVFAPTGTNVEFDNTSVTIPSTTLP